MATELAIPPALEPAVTALVNSYLQLYRDKGTARLCLEVEVQSGGVRDKSLTTRVKV